MSQKLNAVQIKTILIDYLLDNYDTEFIATEVPYLFGFRRADLLAMVDNKTVSFEIKSELDSLSKLSEQIYDYIDVFNEVYIVLAEKFRNSPLISKIPKKVGILYVDMNDKIIYYRKAKVQKLLKKEKLIYFFKKDDLNKINNIDPKLSLRRTREIFLKTNTTKKIIEYSKDILRNKYLNQYKKFIEEKGKYTIEEDLSLITGTGKNNHTLYLP